MTAVLTPCGRIGRVVWSKAGFTCVQFNTGRVEIWSRNVLEEL